LIIIIIIIYLLSNKDTVVQYKKDMVAEQDTPGSGKLLRWP